jgi:hypothetical protein
MSPRARRLFSDSIVVLGSFNPSIFQPAWFSAQHLITSGEAEGANIQVIHSEIAAFNTEYWNLQCTTDRFAVGSDRAPAPEIIRDLVVGIFTLLVHTPVRAVGLNRTEHWEMEDEHSWDSFGDRLVPRNNWNSFLTNPGMRSLTVEGQRPDDYEGYIWVKVEPSTQVGHGVFIDVNDHYVVPSTENKGTQTMDGADKLVELISAEWANSRDRAQEIIRGLLKG